MKLGKKVKRNLFIFLIYLIPLLLITINYLYKTNIYKSLVSNYKTVYIYEGTKSININGSELNYSLSPLNNSEHSSLGNVKLVLDSTTIFEEETIFKPKDFRYMVIGNFDLDTQEEVLLFNISKDGYKIIDFYQSSNKLETYIGRVDEDNEVFKYIRSSTGFLGGLSDLIPVYTAAFITIIILILHILSIIIFTIVKKHKSRSMKTASKK